MNTNKQKILLTGANGLVGSEITADVKIGREIDLRDSHKSDDIIMKHKPTHVIHCAAKVGGIKANLDYMGEYFYDNLMIGINVIESCRKYNVEKLMAFSSTCVFPSNVEYPLTEDKIHLGPPHETNYGYGYSKRMIDIQIRAYNEQYGTKYFSVIPCNLYGPKDNYNLQNSHVVPSLIHKAYLAKINNENIVVWGSGKSLREFLFSKDMANISQLLMDNYNETKPIIVSPGTEISIEELIITICDIMKFKNKIIFDTNKPEGQFRKPSDNTYLKSIIGNYEFTSLRDGLEITIDYFIKNYDNIKK